MYQTTSLKEKQIMEQFKLVDGESCENILKRDGNLLYLTNTKEPTPSSSSSSSKYSGLPPPHSSTSL